MRERMQALIDEPTPAGMDAAEFEEARALLAWVGDHHFTFLGYREYELTESALKAVEGSGLGLLRGGGGHVSRLREAAAGRARARPRAPPAGAGQGQPRSPVHRPAYLDYIGVKRFDAERNVVGERRFLGLYTTRAYREVPANIPVLRRKAQAVRERAGFPPGSHDDKALIEIIDTFPRDELFQIGSRTCTRSRSGSSSWASASACGCSCARTATSASSPASSSSRAIASTPPTGSRSARSCTEALGAETVDWGLRLTEWVLGAHPLHAAPGARALRGRRRDELEARIVEATRSWDDDLPRRCCRGDRRGARDGALPPYATAFPPAYRDDLLARSAVADVQRIEG